MENERNKGYFLTGFLREFATIFTLVIICFTISRKIASAYFPEMINLSSIFKLEGAFLPYDIIYQSLAYAFIMALVSRFLFSNIFITKMPYISRHMIFSLVTLVITVIFSVLFNWIPVNNIFAWLLFVPFFFIACFTAIGLSFLLLKLEDRKYNKLLENYRNRIRT